MHINAKHSFTTERLLIRPLAEQDKDTYINLYTDVKIMRNISAPLTQRAAEKAFHASLKLLKKDKATSMTWAIVSQKSHKCIGIQALNWQTTDSAEIGIMLLRNSNGKLMPEEAIGALIEYGFSYLHLQQINACFAKKNLATARVAKKTGFVYDNTLQPSDTLQRVEFVCRESWHKQYIKTALM